MVRPGTAVLDIGCGTGILSVLAARLGADRVAAADISPEAVKAARHNAALNGVQDRVFVRESDLAQAVDGRFDLAAANILADPLLRLLEQADSFLRTDGTLILSGIREGRMEEVEAAAKRRFDIAEKELRDGWGLLVLRLKSGEGRETAV